MRLLKALLLTLALAAPMLAPLPMAQATVNEVSAANRYTGNGSTTVFSYTFKILTKNDIEVLVDDTVKTVDSHYTVSGLGASGGGSVTFLTAPLSNAKVTLLRKQAAAQASVYTPNEPFPAVRLEKDFDKLVMQVQQAREQLLRAPLFNKKSTQTGKLIDDLVAGKYARVNGAGTGIEWVALTATGTYADPITTRGDLVVGNASGDPSRLGLGAKGYILGSDGTDPAWQSVGVNGTLLEADSTQTNGLLWNTRAAILFKTLTTKGDLLVSTGATAQRKAVGADGTVVAADSNISDGLKYVNVGLPNFRGVVRSHPDSDVVNTKIRADLEMVTTNDGHYYAPAQGLIFDKTVTGSIGGMQAAAVNSTWNKLYYARKRSDGSEGLWGLRAKNYGADQAFSTTPDTNRSLRLLTGTPTDKIAQGVQVTTTGKVEFVDVNLIRVGAVSGNYWLTLEADSSGNPSGTPLATSDKYDASRLLTTNQWIRLPFRTPATLTSGTQYHLVLQGDYAKSDTVFIQWGGVIAGGYANGTSREYNGTTWSATAGGSGLDRNFKLYVTQNDTALSLPAGYDQYVQIGWFYIDGSGNIKKFFARDRDIATNGKTTSWTLIDGTGGGLILFDLSAFVPPVPVTIDIIIGNRNAGAFVDAHFIDLNGDMNVTTTGRTEGTKHFSISSDGSTYRPQQGGRVQLDAYQAIMEKDSNAPSTHDVFLYGFTW